MSVEKISHFKDFFKTNKKIFYIAAVIIWISSTILTLYILRLPTEITEEADKNEIIQELAFIYKADLIPFSLIPDGGIIEFDKRTFTRVTNDIIVHINSHIKSDKPVKIKGTKKVVLKLLAEELWEKEYLLEPETSYSLEGTHNILIDDDYQIGLNDLVSFIEVVEQEISNRPGRYIFEVKPIITGVINYNGKEIPIDLASQSNIEYSDTQITVGEEKTFSRSTPITDTIVIPQKVNILGKEIYVLNAKYLITITNIVIFLSLLISTIHTIRVKKLTEPEVHKIDKKYKARLINVMQDVNESKHERIVLDSFTSLITISDEKECPIFRYENNEKVVYCTTTEGYVFIYEVQNIPAKEINIKNHQVIAGKCYNIEG